MADARWSTLAETLLGHSIRLQPGELLWLETFDLETDEWTRQVAAGALRRGASVLVSQWTTPVHRELIRSGSTRSLDDWAAADMGRMDRVDAYVAVRGDVNPHEWAGVSPLAWNRYNERYLTPVHWQRRIPSKRWCVVRLPGPALAQQAGLPLEDLESMYWNSVELDYVRLRAALKPLAVRIGAARKVKITGEGTDLRFDLPGTPGVPCAGEMNLPDGEVFTAPVLESVNGIIQFNTRVYHQGSLYERIRLEFDGGRVVSASCASGDADRLRRVLDADEGASRVGEWAIGCNPKLHRPVGDALIDEKLAGSHHLALGFSYAEADNGNRSRIHWDLVQVGRPPWGATRIELDGEVLVEDGLFVDPSLDGLNPET